MRKIILVLLICLPISLFAQLSSEEVAQFYIGMKKAEVEKILQRNAIRQGVSFNLEDYRMTSLDELDIPPELQLKINSIEAYDINENQVVFDGGLVSILSLNAKYDDEGWDTTVDRFIAKYGEGKDKGYYYYWLNEDVFLALKKSPAKISLNALRRDLFPMKYIAKLEGEYDEESDEAEETYFPFKFFNKLDLDVSKEEFTDFLSTYGLPNLELEDYASELNQDEELILDVENKKFTKYTIRESSFFFHQNKYIGGSYTLAKLDPEKYDTIIASLDDKFKKHKTLASSENTLFWMDDKIVIALDNNDYKHTALKIIDRNYLSAYALKNIEKEIREPLSNFSVVDIFMLDLFCTKEEVVEAIRKTTKDTDFNLELNSKDLEDLDLPSRLASDYDKMKAYSWNGLSVVFVDDKLNFIFMDKHETSESEREKIKNELTKKYGAYSKLDGEAIVWLNDTLFAIQIYERGKMGVALLNKAWLTEEELKEIDELINENN